MIINVSSIGVWLGFIISLSSVLGLFTKIVNSLFNKKLEPIEKKIDANERKSMENDMDEWRYQCVAFASDLHRGIKKTIYEYQIIFKLADKYEQAVETLHVKNNLFTEELIFIKQSYQKLLDEKK